MTKITDFEFAEEFAEESLGHFMYTGWPEPLKRWKLRYENMNLSIEEIYFWVIDNLNEARSFDKIMKLTDIFAASEQSSFFGASQQRLGIQQDKVSQYLATIGKMVKELFQLVREIRILKERLVHYEKSYERDLPSEISLKGYWIDLVEGGAKNPASVYGMAREIGFVTLPDLFFQAPPMGSNAVAAYVNQLEFNNKIKEVLMRKLKTFLVWKESTYEEMRNRHVFTLKYLRQHYEVIRMYMEWVKPYLRNVKKLQQDSIKGDSVDLVTAFEGSMMEIEVLAIKKMGKTNALFSFHFDYRSRPEMKFQQEGYQRGPVHVGRVIMTFRTYAWSEKELENYLEFKRREDFDLLGMIDGSVKAAYVSLGDELERYLKEAGKEAFGEFDKKNVENIKPKRPGALDPFLSIFKGIGELGGSMVGSHSVKKKSNPRKERYELNQSKEKAKSHLSGEYYDFVKSFKAAHGFIY